MKANIRMMKDTVVAAGGVVVGETSLGFAYRKGQDMFLIQKSQYEDFSSIYKILEDLGRENGPENQPNQLGEYDTVSVTYAGEVRTATIISVMRQQALVALHGELCGETLWIPLCLVSQTPQI